MKLWWRKSAVSCWMWMLLGWHKERFCTKTVWLSDKEPTWKPLLYLTSLVIQWMFLNGIKAPRCPVAMNAWYCQGARKVIEELLHFSWCTLSSSLFDEEDLMSSATVQQLEKGKSPELSPSCVKTGCIVDVIAIVRKIKTNDLKDFWFLWKPDEFRSTHIKRNFYNLVFDFYPRDAMLARVIEIATCLSVRLSRAGIVSKRRKLAAWFLHHLVAPRL